MGENEANAASTPQMADSRNTPRRDINQRIGTPLQRIKEDELSEEETQAKTPVTTINPFEVKADSLYFPSCSPSVFATFARNKTDNGQFRWSIDHVSLLYPADIDETSIPEPWVDPDHENEAQKAIDAFFSQNSIVPSPWSSESKNRRVAKIRRINRKSSFIAANDVATQTKLSIPPSVDLLALLGSQFMYNESNDSLCSSPTSSNGSLRESDVMSTSLRRKLFATEDDCKTPSRLERKDLLLAKQWSTPTINMKSFQSTPSDLLSSSPITPPICSESCNVRTSPQMSPITGPSSQRSIRMRSFNERLEEETNSQATNKTSFDYNHMSETSMSFCMDSQEAVTFQSYSSEKQDTGYVTGSIFSLQNTTSDATSGFQSRITPVTEFSDDCALSNFGSNMSCSNENMSSDGENSKMKINEPIFWGTDKFSVVPNSCSTPAFNL